MEEVNKKRYDITITRNVGGRTNKLIITNSVLNSAVKELSHAGLKLYLYLVQNKNGFELTLRRKHCEKIVGLSSASFTRGFKELREKG